MDRPFPAYKGNEPYIFVSYAHEDSDVVYPEIQWLKDQGFNIWYDEGISPGHEWHQELAEHIDSCHLFLYFITPRSAVSEHCQREVHYAVDNGKQMLAVHLEETDLPSGINLSMSSIQAIMRHELSELDYRIKLLTGTSDHLQRGVAQVANTTNTDRKFIYAILALVLLVVGFQFSDRFLSDDAGSGSVSANPTVVRASINLNQALPPIPGFGGRTALSLAPDGSTLAFFGEVGNSSGLLLRDLATQETQEFEVGISVFFYSPDSQNLLIWVVGGEFSIMPAQGGGLRPLPIEIGFRIAWFSDEEIIYQHVDGGLRIYSLADETDEPVPNIDASNVGGWLFYVPQRAAFMFQKNDTLRAQNQLEIQMYDLESQSTALVTNNGYHPQYVNSGHVLFIRRGDLWAVPFDLEALKVTGPEARIVEGVDSQPLATLATYTVSDAGRLVYLPGPEFFSDQTVLVWTDRSGRQEELPLPAGNYAEPRVSPDGELLALTSRQADGSTDIWVYDFSRDTFSPRTFSGNSLNPVWNADSSRLFYQQTSVLSGRAESRGEIWVMNADGTGQAERILDATAVIDSFSQSDEKLIYTSYDGAGDGIIGQLNTLTFSDDAWVSAPLLNTDFHTAQGVVSPDGRWIAYQSFESGNAQVYVGPYPNLDGGKWPVSTGSQGGLQPSWGPNSDELFFVRADGTLMRTETTIEGDSFLHGIVEPLFSNLLGGSSTYTSNTYSVSDDGERFLVISSVPVDILGQGFTELIMVENFFEELRRLAPADPL